MTSDDEMIDLEPAGFPSRSEGKGGDLVNLQMILVTSSMNHEYALKEFEAAKSYDKKQDLLARMSHLKNLYFSVRGKLALSHPDRVETIERELRLQKLTVFSEPVLN